MSSSEDNNNSPRRGSFASQRLSGLFGRSASIANNGTPAFPGPITAAAHQANQRRRMSVATVGLGASPNPSSPFGIRARQDSLSSDGSVPQGDSAIDDSGDASSPTRHGFGRRLSMGSKAMSNMATGSMSNGKGSVSPSTTPPSKARAFASGLEESNEEEHQTSPLASSPSSNLFNRRTGEGGSGGFNWSNEMRARAQRSSSISSPTAGNGFPRSQKSASVSATPYVPPPAPTIKQQSPPDHFQERILKGDFYMD